MVQRSHWEETLELLDHLQRGIKMQNVLKEHDLTPTQLVILYFLNKYGAQKATGVAKHVGITPGAATQVSDEMVRAGLLTKQRLAEDRRIVHLNITVQGRRKLSDVRDARKMAMLRILDKLGYEDTEVFLRVIRRLVEILEEERRLNEDKGNTE